MMERENVHFKEKDIQRLLHHRPPYLMVSEVTYLTEKEIHSIKVHRGDEAHLPGHFPGAQVVPGAMLQELCTQSAGILITKFYSPVSDYHSELTKGHALGVLSRVRDAKYHKVVYPHHPIVAKVQLIDTFENFFDFKAKVYQRDELCAKLAFRLVNTPDSILYDENK